MIVVERRGRQTRFRRPAAGSLQVGLLAAGLGLGVVGQVAPARADQAEGVVSTAREVAKQGLAAYDAGNYEEAFEKLSQAYGAVRLPTLALYTARAAAKLGKLVKAAELYREASSLAPEASWQSGQLEAQAEARAERAELLRRIPRLTIRITGGSESPDVRIDGTLIPASLIRAEQLVDPGSHSISVISGQTERTLQVALAEGQNDQVEFVFPEDAPDTAEVLPPQPRDSQPPAGQFQRTAGWVTVGVGGAAVLTGVGLGIYLVWKRGELIEGPDCDPDGTCDEDAQKFVDKYNERRTWSTVSIVAGSVLAAAGVTLVLTAPKTKGPEVTLRAVPNGLVLSGKF